MSTSLPPTLPRNLLLNLARLAPRLRRALRTGLAGLLAAGLALPALPALPAFGAMPDDDAIRQILRQRIDTDKRTTGIVVGVLDARGMRVIAHGSSGTARPLDGDSLFEIGSITKVFTTLLLQDMVARGEVALDDPIAKYLPAGVTVPSKDGRAITLLDLAVQRSGLPRMPGNFKPANPQNPFVDYDAARLYAYLGEYALTRAPGAQFEYSNTGLGLLGHVLSLRAGKPYETLLRERVLGPLGLDSTAMHLDSALQARLARGHNAALAPAQNWDFDVLAGAGALRSSAHDMLAFLAANLGQRDTPLKASMAATHAPRADAGRPGTQIGLGWLVFQGPGATVTAHNGGTGGYRSFAGFNKDTGEAVVVLSNAGGEVEDIGRHLLDQKLPLMKFDPPRDFKQIALAAEKFDPYVGTYQLTPNMRITITREGEKFYGQADGQPRFELKAESETAFFAGRGEVQVRFERDDKGEVARLVLRQAGRDMPAPRQR